MADRPVLFSAPMIRALIGGRKTKTMTRRLAWHGAGPCQERDRASLERRGHLFERRGKDCFESAPSRWQKVRPGDRLWVRETISTQDLCDGECHYRATIGEDTDYFPEEISEIRWTPSIHMPRWASRLTLIVEATRIERLQDITEADAAAEGCVYTDFGEYQPPGQASLDGGKTFHPFKMRQHNGWHSGEATHPDQCFGSAWAAFSGLWEHLNGPGAWDANPEVVVLTFRVVRENIDKVEAVRG